ncbi:MAG: exodeoxyribonuclease subunit alpha [Moraxellaceae bacterium]|jgi:exodeoxyribonuclease V alpha subunit|nr:exodeoxyribonuclease subunit alpha [Moraxellaceae bacterium]
MSSVQIDSILVRTYRHWLQRVAGDLPPSLHDAIAELFEAVEAGHVCIRVPLETTASWQGHAWVGRPGSYAPFVLEDSGRFYLSRYRDHEECAARLLRERAGQGIAPADPAVLRAGLAALFPDDPEDRQRQAALLAQFKPLTLVSGGPGTGKTTTVVKLLALLQQQAGATPLRILLAAPTGKAAQRLVESIRASKQKLDLPPALLAGIPEEARTLHRLLGAEGDTGRYRHGAANPLHCDLLLIDEASMIDLAMMHAVLAALSPTARLVLLGDRDQLASVEAGSVFGDLCASGGCSDALQQRLAPYNVKMATGDDGHGLADCRIELTRSYRFAADSAIGALARASREGDADAFSQVLAAGGDVARLPPAGLREAVQKGYAPYQAAARAGDPAAAFATFLKFRVLCAHRQGPAGVEGLNALLEPASGGLYAGRPVIVRANDYALRLFNGDIGLCLPTADGLRVFFESAPGQYRALAPGRLPPHESAWAMTVHQSQGSEFDDVLLVLPETVTPVLNRPLVYTAVTRARSRFALCGSEAVLGAALATLPRRESGLVEKLGAPG